MQLTSVTLAEKPANAASYYHADHLGSTLALSDDEGRVSGRAAYSAYGQVIGRQGEMTTPFQWHGGHGVMTEENGLVHMRARYYHPVLSRFLSEDPIRFEGGLNWYGYCDGDPVMRMDPSGLESFLFPQQYAQSAEFRAGFQQGANHSFAVVGSGFAVGAASAGVVSGIAVGALAVGVDASIVTGALFTTGVAGSVATGYNVYKNPSADNLAFNVAALGGGVLVSGVVAGPLGQRLSPVGYTESVNNPTFHQEFSMRWTNEYSKPSIVAYLRNFNTANATGPTFGGAVGAITLTASGVSSVLRSSNSSNK